MWLKVKRLSQTAKLPTKAHKTDAGWDLYADFSTHYKTDDEISLRQDETVKIPTGIAITIPEGYCGVIKDRSSMASKCMFTHGGIVDNQYTGEILVVMSGKYSTINKIKHGDKIAQMLILPVPEVEIEEVDNLDETERGEGGFGSTGQ